MHIFKIKKENNHRVNDISSIDLFAYKIIFSEKNGEKSGIYLNKEEWWGKMVN